MPLKEDCINFRYIEKDIIGIGDLVKKTKSIPNCTLNKMALGGCPKDCLSYES